MPLSRQVIGSILVDLLNDDLNTDFKITGLYKIKKLYSFQGAEITMNWRKNLLCGVNIKKISQKRPQT